ncbi:MAG: type II secretion system minor pseudopilin GspJ [Pseudomonadota bacterium]
MSQREFGFTLVEVMIALMIFSVVAVLAFSTVDATGRASRSIEREMDDLLALQRLVQMVSSDVYQAQPRPVREPVGTAYRAPILADIRNTYFFEVTRGGNANPLGVQRSTALRVGYRLEEDELIRAQWPVLDNLLATEPDEIIMLDGVLAVQMRFLPTEGAEWVQEWPLGGANAPASQPPPRAVEIIIEHEYWGELRRMFEVTS